MHPSGASFNESSLAALVSLGVDSTFGAMYLSNIVGAMLFMLTTIQLYVYCQRNQDDPRSMKFLACFLWFLDALHFALTTHADYTLVIPSIRDPAAGLRVSWSSRSALCVAGASDTIVTFVLARRIWKFGSRKRAIQVIVAIVSIGNLVVLAADVAMVVLTTRPGVNSLTFGVPWLWCGTFGLRATVDILIACTITCMLYEYRCYAKRTRSVIYLIMLYSVSTCTLTTVCVIISVITFVTLPHSFVSYAVMQTLPKLMLNALFVLLNSRQTLRGMVDRAQMHPVSLSTVQSHIGDSGWAGRGTLDTKSDGALDMRREVPVQSFGEAPSSTMALGEV